MKALNQQTAKDKFWKDETGIDIPVTRIRSSEKMREKQAYNVAMKAISINKALCEFKDFMADVSDRVYVEILKENDMKKDGKGNFTWYNFDRSIKVEVAINERIDFDETLIGMCKIKLDEFIDDNLQGVDSFVKDLVNDAFSNTKGKLDAKKVMSLLKHKSKIKDARYQIAMDFLEKSIRRPDSKKYMRVAVKNDEGEYVWVNLNFSNI